MLNFKQPYFTISHADTHEQLGKWMFSPTAVLARLLADLPRTKFPSLSEWYVTEWYGDGTDFDNIIGQVSADEFVMNQQQ